MGRGEFGEGGTGHFEDAEGGTPLVDVAFVELAAPSLAEGLAAMAARARTVVVVPLFLFSAGHVKNDVPLALSAAREAHPGTRFVAATALGVHPALAELAYVRACEAGEVNEKTALVVVGRGASDPDANGDFCKVVRLVAEGRGLARVEAAFAGVARPSVDEALERAAAARPASIVVVPYLLFGGRLTTKLRDQIDAFRARWPWIRVSLAACLGADARLFAIVDERVRQALAGSATLACDTCMYRTAMPGAVAQVGGLRAMLYSVRHQLTHTQAMPHVHAHKPLKKHVLVCGNADCVDRGSLALLDALRRRLRDAGQERQIRVTRTSCMGRCGEGPTVAVYPDGVWYRGVKDGDARELVDEHLVGDRLVARLVDNVMQ